MSTARHRLSGTRPVSGVVGTRRTVCYRVRRKDLASRIYRVLGPSRWKPPVFATGRLLWLCELAVMMSIPGVSLGTEVTVKHVAPAVRGPIVIVTATCTGRDARYWEWYVEIQDSFELVAVCSLRFAVGIDRQRYRRRLVPKLAARSTGLVWWLWLLDSLSLLMVVALPVQVAYVWHSRTSMLITEAALVVGWLVSLTGLPSAVIDWFTVRPHTSSRN